MKNKLHYTSLLNKKIVRILKKLWYLRLASSSSSSSFSFTSLAWWCGAPFFLSSALSLICKVQLLLLLAERALQRTPLPPRWLAKAAGLHLFYKRRAKEPLLRLLRLRIRGRRRLSPLPINGSHPLLITRPRLWSGCNLWSIHKWKKPSDSPDCMARVASSLPLQINWRAALAAHWRKPRHEHPRFTLFYNTQRAPKEPFGAFINERSARCHCCFSNPPHPLLLILFGLFSIINLLFIRINDIPKPHPFVQSEGLQYGFKQLFVEILSDFKSKFSKTKLLKAYGIAIFIGVTYFIMVHYSLKYLSNLNHSVLITIIIIMYSWLLEWIPRDGNGGQSEIMSKSIGIPSSSCLHCSSSSSTEAAWATGASHMKPLGGPPLPFGFCGSCGFATSSPSYGSWPNMSRRAAPKINNITLNMDSNAGPSEAPPLATLAKAPSQPPEALQRTPLTRTGSFGEGAASQLDIKRGGVLGASQFFIKEAGHRPPSYSQYDAVRDRISPTPKRAKYDAVRDGVIQPVQPKQSLPQQVQEEERVSVYYDQVRDLTTKTPTLKGGGVSRASPGAAHTSYSEVNNKITAAAPLMESSSVRLRAPAPVRAPASFGAPAPSPWAAPAPSPVRAPDVTNRESKYYDSLRDVTIIQKKSGLIYDPVKDKNIEEPARGSAPAPSRAATQGLAAPWARAPAGYATPVASPVRAPAAPAHLGTNRIPVEDPRTFIVPALQGLKAAALSLDASPHEDQIAVSTDLVDKFYAQKSELALKWMSKRPWIRSVYWGPEDALPGTPDGYILKQDGKEFVWTINETGVGRWIRNITEEEYFGRNMPGLNLIKGSDAVRKLSPTAELRNISAKMFKETLLLNKNLKDQEYQDTVKNLNSRVIKNLPKLGEDNDSSSALCEGSPIAEIIKLEEMEINSLMEEFLKSGLYIPDNNADLLSRLPVLYEPLGLHPNVALHSWYAMHPRHVFNRFFNIDTGKLGKPNNFSNPSFAFVSQKHSFYFRRESVLNYINYYLIDNINLGMEILNYEDYPIIRDIKLSELRASVRLRAAYIIHSLSNPILLNYISDTSIESLLIRRVWVESNIHWIDFGLGLDKTIDSTAFRNYLLYELDNIEIALKNTKVPEMESFPKA